MHKQEQGNHLLRKKTGARPSRRSRLGITSGRRKMTRGEIHKFGAIATLLVYVLLIAGLTVFAGCSGTRQIARSTAEVRGLAESSLERFNLIADQSPLVSETAKKGAAEQSQIVSLTDKIQTVLPTVEDKIPEWMRLAMVIGSAILGIVILVLLWQTGIGPLIKAMMNRITFMIPKAKKSEAKLMRRALEDGDSEKVREAVAFKRASDSTFDAAWKAEKTQRVAINRADVT